MSNPITDAMRAAGSEIDLDDEAMLRRAVETAGAGGIRAPRWVAVRHVFVLGSMSGAALCVACGLDPHEFVGTVEPR